jgi:predicted DNA-binding ribbon-helix-helix protein
VTLKKRSLSIAGHQSSLALEPEFWAALDTAAELTGRSIPSLVAEIDSGRPPDQGLASAVRVWLLKRTRS